MAEASQLAGVNVTPQTGYRLLQYAALAEVHAAWTGPSSSRKGAKDDARNKYPDMYHLYVTTVME